MPSARTKFVDIMTLYPQRCVLTGYPNQRNQEQALDLGFEIEDYGHVYVSALGMQWLARQFGYVHKNEADNDVEAIHEELRAARKRIKELEDAMSHVPQTIEGVINGLKQLSVDAITELAGVTNPGEPTTGIVDSEDRTEEDGADSGTTVKAARRNSKASSK